ncbi:MAG: DUF2849 domain-containing protein [Bauldia sp.]
MFKAASAGPQKAVTANRLGDGRVVFLAADGGWVMTLAEARLVGDDELADAMRYAQAQHDARIVVEPYAIDVELVDGRPVASRLREHIRAVGPSVDFGEAENRRLGVIP